MKKNLKKILATAFAGLLAVATLGTTVPTLVNAEESTESYKLFVAFGGDAAEENDWGLSYAGGEVSGDITVTDGEIAVGETVTVGLEFANPVVNAWYFAPTMIAENVVNAEFDVKVLVDGKEVAVDTAAGDNWWYEGTGDYSDKEAIRIAGGFNEWGAQYIEEPSGFTKLEFEVTAKSIEIGEPAAAGEAVESTETYDMYLAFGGDAAEENDWALSYAGGEASEGITATDAKIAVGETATVKLDFANPVVNAWYFAPFIVAENVVEAEFEVSAKIDGKDVELDMSAGDNWWYEATGDFSDKEAVRIAGGFNEWGAQYMAEPSGFTSIEYTITAKSIKVGVAGDADTGSALPTGNIDLDGTYHAYIGFQTPVYSFRNAWDGDDGYGNDTPEFNQVTGWGEENAEIVKDGSFVDATIAGNGTYTVKATGLDTEGEFDSQEYMNLIFFSTDIPTTGDVTFSDVILKVNGSEVSTNGFVVSEGNTCLRVQLQNIWDTENNIAQIGYYPTPVTDIEITFTISGFNYDNDGSAVTTDNTDNGDDATVDTAKKSKLPLIIGICCAVVVVIVVVVIIVVTKGKKKE